ncbi:MAG: pilus assembly protein TadG-related protein [Ornithinimicrobium sp.]
MQRLRQDGERGAVALVVAVLMPVLLGFTALAVDVAAVHADRQQLQTGADAAALAIGQACAAGESCDDDTIDSVAAALTIANKNDGAASANATRSTAPNMVAVTASTVRQHWFAPILGIESSDVAARSAVTWGIPTSGTAMLPVAFSICEFNAQTGGGLPSATESRTLKFTKTSGTDCTGPSGNLVPGGFGWLSVVSGSCTASTAVGNLAASKPGKAVPSDCTTGDLEALQGRTVLLPIFDEAFDGGSNASYRIMGYAAFTITGYHFGPPKFSWNSGCKGNDRCLHGYFTRFADTSDAFTYGDSAPDLGGYVAKLILPAEETS